MQKPQRHKRFPWINPKIAHRNARLHRLVRKGLTGYETKEQLRAQAAAAAAGKPIPTFPRP